MLTSLVSLIFQTTIATATAEMQSTVSTIENSASQPSTNHKIIKYDISSRGEITGNLEEFRTIVRQTLADPRGWNRAGVTFEEVTNNGAMHVILATGAEVQSASPTGCSDTLSCRVGSLILINDIRWTESSDSYISLNIPLSDYRTMVVNHEVGHYLGHPHTEICEPTTNLAPVMLQQSTGLRGCLPNIWPLRGELWWR